MLRGRGPEYLLRLPAEGEQAELFVDVLATGRLRGPWDLAAFANEDLGLDKADKESLRILLATACPRALKVSDK